MLKLFGKNVKKKAIDKEAIVVVSKEENSLGIEKLIVSQQKPVVTFHRAKDAVASLREETPAAIILQAELDNGNGYTVCNFCKKNDKLKKIPLVFFSPTVSEMTLLQHARLKTKADAYVLDDDPELLLRALQAAKEVDDKHKPLFFHE